MPQDTLSVNLRSHQYPHFTPHTVVCISKLLFEIKEGASNRILGGQERGKKSFICLEGKSMTPRQGNTFLFRSSQQLPRLRLGPLKGWLENLGKKIFEWHFCVEWWKILDSLSFDRKFLTQQNYNLGKFLKENFWLRRWKIFDRKFWINVFNGCTIFDNQTI